MQMKKNLVKLLAVLGCMALAVGAALFTPVQVSAATPVSISVTDFRMEYGASVRFGASDGKDGIRFTATLPKTVYDKLEALQTTENVTVNYGMLIVPADYVTSGSTTYKSALTEETVFGANAVYTITDCTPTAGDNACHCGKTHISGVEYGTLEGTDERMILKGSLVDLKAGNRMREFVGMGYIKYSHAEASQYVFAENARGEDGTGEADIANNTRSMSYVAQLAIAGGQDDSDDTLYQTYIKPFAETEYKYTIEHYFPTSDGSYGAPVVETAYAKLGETVTAKHVADSTSANREDYLTYAAYTISEDSQTTGVVYANGNTVLTCYYVAPQTDKSAYTLTAFDISAETAYLSNQTYQSVTPKISYLDSYPDGTTTKYGVAVYETSTKSNVANGAFLCLKFDETTATRVWEAFSDETTEFSLLITICATTETEAKEAEMCRGGEMGSITFGTWQTVVLTETELVASGWTSEDSVKGVMQGSADSSYLFYLKGNDLTKGMAITYYIDSIAYEVQ